jgi:hypothetical protein
MGPRKKPVLDLEDEDVLSDLLGIVENHDVYASLGEAHRNKWKLVNQEFFGLPAYRTFKPIGFVSMKQLFDEYMENVGIKFGVNAAGKSHDTRGATETDLRVLDILAKKQSIKKGKNKRSASEVDEKGYFVDENLSSSSVSTSNTKDQSLHAKRVHFDENNEEGDPQSVTKKTSISRSKASKSSSHIDAAANQANEVPVHPLAPAASSPIQPFSTTAWDNQLFFSFDSMFSNKSTNSSNSAIVQTQHCSSSALSMDVDSLSNMKMRLLEKNLDIKLQEAKNAERSTELQIQMTELSKLHAQVELQKLIVQQHNSTKPF